jgi:DNA sulfur modification protein DndD
LKNFRQFKGESPEIHFGLSRDRRITVIYGTNGAGKTALLNAFTWALYGKHSRGFLLPDNIVNKAAIREAKPGEEVEAWVELKFEHLDFKFVLRKQCRIRRGATELETIPLGEPVTELSYAGPDGQWKSETSIADAIGRVLPEELHRYFFFDGERIERLVQPNNEERADIADATKKLSSLEILERAIRHLGSARRMLQADLQRVGDAKTVELLQRREGIENEISLRKRRESELSTNIESHIKTETEIDDRLRNLAAARVIQQQRDGLLAAKLAREDSRRQVTRQLSDQISSDAYAIFLPEVCDTYSRVISAMRQRGELPHGIKRPFVDDLLTNSTCICGRSLGHSVDPVARAHVEEWRNRAGLAGVEEKAIRMEGEVRQQEHKSEQFWQQLDRLQLKRREDKEEISRLEAQLETISEQLRHSDQEELGQLEERRVQIRNARDRDMIEQATCGAEIKRKEKERDDIDAELKRQKATEDRQRVAQARLTATQEAIDRISESKRRFEIKFRADLTKKVRDLFAKISFTPYVPEIAEDYALRLRESAGGVPLPVAASQGESQILSLCFIGGVIDLVREYQARQERLVGPQNCEFPLVMDSPFGTLGTTYRRYVADHITSLADQVIIMVTNTQWRGEVEESFRGRVGKHYVLQYYSPKPDMKPEIVTVGGSTYDLIKSSPDDFEYTIILEVPHV